MKKYKLRDTAYFADVFLIEGTRDELNRWLKKRDWKPLADESSGRWHNEETMEHYLLIPKEKKHLTLWQEAALAHEVLHMTFAVLEHAGIVYCSESEEAFTYYFQFMFVECLKRLLK